MYGKCEGALIRGRLHHVQLPPFVPVLTGVHAAVSKVRHPALTKVMPITSVAPLRIRLLNNLKIY